MENLNDLYYFVQIVDHAGFAPAGRALGEPKSKLSRRIANLEKRLGVQLIQRSTRHFSVTEIGQTYYAHCKAMLVEADAAQEAIELSRAEPCGIVRVTCPIALLGARVGRMLATFMVQYPGVEIHLDASDRRVDPVDEAIDIAIRARPLPLEDSELIIRDLGNRQQCLVASPELLAKTEAPKVPADLVRLPSLGHGRPHQDFEWNLYGHDGAEVSIKHNPRLITLDMTALRLAALAGVGVVQLPHIMVNEEIAEEKLVRLVPDWIPHLDNIHLVYASRRGMLPSVRALIEFLVEEFEALDEA